MKNLLEKANRIVLKVGTAGITSDHSINSAAITNLAHNTSKLVEMGKYVTIVTSGAIAAGRRRLHSWHDVAGVPDKQTYAAVGQPLLMKEYIDTFGLYGLNVAQYLVSKGDFDQENRFSALVDSYSNTVRRGIIPIFNENDSVATEEIKFSDNDELQFLVATRLGADVMINLILRDGLLKNFEVLRFARSYDAGYYDKLRGEVREGRGGLQGKLRAIQAANRAGIPCIIGNVMGDIVKMMEGKEVHTRFMTTKKQ